MSKPTKSTSTSTRPQNANLRHDERNPGVAKNIRLGQIKREVAEQGKAIVPKPIDGNALTFPTAIDTGRQHMTNGMQMLTACAAMSNLTTPQKAELNTYLLTMKDAIEETQKHMRARVLDDLLKTGTPVGNGSREIDLGNGQVQRAIPMKSGPDPKKVYKYLAQKSPTLPAKYMRQTVEYDLGGDKQERENRTAIMVRDGVVSLDELTALEYEPSYRVGKVQEKKADSDE